MAIRRSGKTALVTGAARGLGLCIARNLALHGVNIAGTDIRTELLAESLAALGGQYDVETLALGADSGCENGVSAAVATVYQQWQRIDILVNNAGLRHVGPVHEMAIETWDRMHASNLRGQFLYTREVLRQGMMSRNEGTIIFISSGSGKRGEKGSSAYCASKFGVTGFAESVAKDLKHTRIRCTNVIPGMIWTPMAEESEVAHLDLDWLDPGVVSEAVLFCINQDADTIIPELQVYHRSQI